MPLAQHDHRPGSGIRVVDLTVAYGSSRALDGLTASVPRGSSCALVGPNGSGKTTLLHVLSGIVDPTSGTVDHGDPPPVVAYVVQRHRARPWMPLTTSEVIRMGCYRRRGLLGRIRPPDTAAIAAAASRMEVTGLFNRQFSELSGGQQQRVLLAQALVQSPSLLLLDEPITGLDLASQQKILELIDEETAAGTTVVLATHNLDEARHADQVLLLDGRLVAAGAPDEVLTQGFLAEAYAGRLLGDHHSHNHAHDLLVIDEHTPDNH